MRDRRAIKVAKWLTMRLNGRNLLPILEALETVMDKRRELSRRWEHACDVSDYLCDLNGIGGNR